MPYTHTTLATLKTQLARRLSDQDDIFWVPAELEQYILEALRVFGSLTGFWRAQASFNTVASTAFYDITAINPAFTALLDYTVLDTDLVSTIQNHFLEPAPGNSWPGTDMFDLADVTRALQHRRDQFLAETGVVVTRSTPATVVGPPSTREDLVDTVVDVRRLAWVRASDSVVFHLWREDEVNLTAFDAAWQTAGVPIAYSVTAVPPITVQLAPPAAVAGSLDLLTVNAGAALDPAAGVILGFPDDLSWAVKWGAMADLLGHAGQAKDPRSVYCEQRFRLGIEMAKQLPTITHADIGGTPVLVDSLVNLDSFRADWQNDAEGTPDILAIASHNLIALSPTPDGVFSITLDVVRRADVPTGPGDDIEIGREDLGGILDYAEHLAAFKMGGAEWDLTQRQAEEFMTHSLMRNQLMTAGTVGSIANMFSSSRREQQDRPRRIVSV